MRSILIALLLAPSLAWAQDSIPFPVNSASQPVVQAWINRYLPVAGFVIGAWSPNVVMLVSTAKLQADRWPEASTEVWTEVLRPAAAKAVGWRASVELDVFACDKNQYRTESTLLFARADRQGGFDVGPGDTSWQTPEDGTTMDTVERAACYYAKLKHAPPRATPARRKPALPPQP